MERTKANVGNIRNSFNSIKSQINVQIMNRNSLAYRFTDISNEILELENKIRNINNVINVGISVYYNAESEINGKKTTLNDLLNKFNLANPSVLATSTAVGTGSKEIKDFIKKLLKGGEGSVFHIGESQGRKNIWN